MIKNTFDKGPEGWCSYDYHWSIVAKGRNIFILTTWEPAGGVNDSGYIWCDETRWSADTPESPVSLLPFITYLNWTGGEPLDLREARVSVHLRGDDLQLHGAQCYFWAVMPGSRWHCTGQPLTIGESAWASNVLTLHNDESRWHRSWADTPHTLDETLAHAVSYGISLVGFGQEPRGKFCMDELEVRLSEE
jgi:hypothetical protein